MRPIEVVGSLNIDLVSTTARVPGPGETLQASSFSTGFGGKGANQAVAAARLLDEHARSSGKAVRIVGAVGRDQFGEDFLKQLKTEGIDSSDVRVVDTAKTGSTIIVVEESTGENRILFTPAANFDFEPSHVQLLPDPSLVVLQLEIPFQTVLESLKMAKQMGKETIFNPAPATPLPDHAYQNVDHLIVNESEASMLSGTAEEELEGSLGQVAKHFITKGVHVVVITLGSKGVYWLSSEDAHDRFTGSKMSARAVKAIDTTAAGDTFVGAYTAHLSRIDHKADREWIKNAIEYATRAASVAVTKSGAQASIPSTHELPPMGA